MEFETSLDWMEGKITNEEFIIREESALRCTLNTKKLFNSEELYLTEMEMLCIRKKMQVLNGMEKRKYIEFLLHFFEWCDNKHMLSDCIVMYEFVMVRMASELANMGDFHTATRLDKSILKESLRCRRVWEIANILYDLSWNEIELGKESGRIEKEKTTENLRQCVLLSRFCKQCYDEKFYCKRYVSELCE